MESEVAALQASQVVQGMKRCGITHVVYLPGTETADLYDALLAEPSIILVPVCREGESMAVAAGLWVGGKEPAVLIQSTGFFESGDSIRGIVQPGRFPLLMLIGYRGWDTAGRDLAAVYLEPVLKAYDIPYTIVEGDGSVDRVVTAHQQAHQESRAVAALILPEARR